MKLYGFALTPNQNNCFGVAIDEIGNYRGHHTSSNYSFLKSDLASKAPECEFEFIENDIPYKNIIYSLVNEINFIGNDKAKNDADYLKLSAENNKLTQLFSVQLDVLAKIETLTKQLEVAREALNLISNENIFVGENGWRDEHYLDVKQAKEALAKLDAIERGEG